METIEEIEADLSYCLSDMMPINHTKIAKEYIMQIQAASRAQIEAEIMADLEQRFQECLEAAEKEQYEENT